jgi:arylsulfatase A-like enzyme
VHPWLFNNREYLNSIDSIRRVAAEVSGVDDGVGTVLETLHELGLERDTLVVFCADQGWVGGQNGLWGMGDHTRPLTAFDGMMRVPLLVRHTGRISAGAKSDLMVSNYDLMPTVLSYLGLADGQNLNPRSPGRDFSPTLLGRDQPDWVQRVFYEAENARAIRTSTAKYVHRHPGGPHELYDLASDPGEEMNLYGQPRRAALQRDLETQLREFFDRHADPQYDLYRGGGSKTRLLSDPKRERIVPEHGAATHQQPMN